jgi:hypothetical protein
MYPKQGGLLTHVYDKATTVPFGHLIVDSKQETPEALRLRSIRDKRTVVYIPRDIFKALPAYKKGDTSTTHRLQTP